MFRKKSTEQELRSHGGEEGTRCLTSRTSFN